MLSAVGVCRSCGATPREGARFCESCGSRLSTDPAEYKQVTVLFADVVRSMDIAAAVELERLREIMTEVLERLAGVVRRFGGTVEYNGDGVMALFGAPVALEDHAFRGCLAALAIQDEARRLAARVSSADGVDLRVRVGLNSGQVIAGQVGSGAFGFRATGEPVGLAQRMESAAPPGGVMLSESTARLVEQRADLSEPQWVRIKGSDEPVRSYRLLAAGSRERLLRKTETPLVGRRSEMAALDAVVDRTASGLGGLVSIVGPPGIGKSRAARETAAAATARGLEVFWTFCESHTRDVPFYAVSQLLRVAVGVADLDDLTARKTVRTRFPDAEPQDILLLDDVLGIADPDVPSPQLDPDGRRRRLMALIGAAALARSTSALHVIEDVHWIDSASESMLADLLAAVPHTNLMVLITYRPEYQGSLTALPADLALVLAPLGDSDALMLIGQLTGSDPSVGELSAIVAERAAGNPFFAEEMVRDLVQRKVLTGERGDYRCTADLAEVSVPATVQAAIAARMDRLSVQARRTVQAASVIGGRFEAELLGAIGVDVALAELLAEDLIDRVCLAPRSIYAFAHPLIRSVAYESQLKSERAELHRRLAVAIELRDSGAVEENAALIAEHREAAGDFDVAHGWHMRAGVWSANRDLKAARLVWHRAMRIADSLPEHHPGQLGMRIAPRTLLCATDWQAREVQHSRARFAELRELCTLAGDNVSLAIGMTALTTELLYEGRVAEGARLSTRQMALLEAIEDPIPTMGLAAIAFCNWLGVFEFRQILRWSQRIVDLSDGDPARGAGYGVGSPLAIALAWRGTARWNLDLPGWRDDLNRAVAMARRSNAETLSGTIAWTYGFALQYGVLRSDESVLEAAEEAVQTAEQASSDRALGLAGYTLAVALLSQEDHESRRRGLELMMQSRAIWLHKRAHFLIPVTDMWVAREMARDGNRDRAIPAMRIAAEELRCGFRFYGLWGTGVLVEALLERATNDDLAEADEEIDRLVGLAAEHDSVMLSITLLRLHALRARTRGDADYLERVARYRSLADSMGFEGHLSAAEVMADRASAPVGRGGTGCGGSSTR